MNSKVIIVALMTITCVEPCERYLREGLRHKDMCLHVSRFANCLASSHKAMRSPFGESVDTKIGEAVRNSVKQLCNQNCPVVISATASPSKDLEAAGNRLKVCAFDIIVKGGAKKKKVCEKIEDMVECVINAATNDTYMLTKEVTDVSAYIMTETLRLAMGVKCNKPTLKQKLQEKCIGLIQSG